MTTDHNVETDETSKFDIADQHAATVRYRDLLVRRLARDDLTKEQRERAFRNLVTAINLIRSWNQLLQTPAEQEARALIASERQGSYD